MFSPIPSDHSQLNSKLDIHNWDSKAQMVWKPVSECSEYFIRLLSHTGTSLRFYFPKCCNKCSLRTVVFLCRSFGKVPI